MLMAAVVIACTYITYTGRWCYRCLIITPNSLKTEFGLGNNDRTCVLILLNLDIVI